MTSEGASPSGITAAERMIRRERWIILAGLVLITLLSWIYVLSGAGTGMGTRAMSTFTFPPPERMGMVLDWSFSYALIMLMMWWVMMIAMMTPSAAPLILLYGTAYRHEQRKGRLGAAAAPTFSFLAGYLLAWLGFSAVATFLQWTLEQLGLLHSMMMWSTNRQLSAALLIAAGLYQLSPLKHACLAHCRSPAAFLAEHYRPGASGALRMGLLHGAYCLGCCWVIMALLFAGGIMNVVWIAGLAVFVLLEKVLPWSIAFTRVSAAIFLALGLWLLFTS
ncbi:DUF2182 domain-containing protein [Rhizobiales bacterium]|uniref:DUF2182 domain-containing protein n=1 Tax=Hongsoonwoonella zoysiae TaxID=2821844 RepID=UPI0015605CB9|nr:DUF2182 domain-containing protein [Hongsoonwoonella zoysiae]NRG18375.1 DUF2182 domain-containing protein [Hongsoonwoonella zoysiae]